MFLGDPAIIVGWLQHQLHLLHNALLPLNFLQKLKNEPQNSVQVSLFFRQDKRRSLDKGHAKMFCKKAGRPKELVLAQKL
jgi:hypothetical protein